MYELPETARRIIQETNKSIELIPAKTFSSLLDILQYEMLFEDDFYDFSTARIKDFLQEAFASKQLYGFKMEQSVVEDLSTEFEESLGDNHFDQQFTQLLRQTTPRGTPAADQLLHAAHGIRSSASIFDFICLTCFLPFFCWIDESNFGSLKYIWAHRSLRRMGIAREFLNRRFTSLPLPPPTPLEKTAAEATAATQFPIPAHLIPTLRNKARLMNVSDDAELAQYSHSLLREASSSDNSRVYWEGILNRRVFLFQVNWPEPLSVQEAALLEANMARVEGISIVTLPFLCVLGIQDSTKCDVLWSHPWVGCLQLDQLLQMKRSAKYILRAENTQFWKKMGFSVGVLTKELQELQFADSYSGAVASPILRGSASRLPRNEANCQKMAKLVNEKLGTKYDCQVLYCPEMGIEFWRFPGDGRENKKEVLFGRKMDDEETQLSFRWNHAKWEEHERQVIIECFMQVFSFYLS